MGLALVKPSATTDESYTIWSEKDKITLILGYQNGDSWSKIAAKLRRSESACKQRVYALRSAKRNINVLSYVNLDYNRKGKKK